MTYTEKLIFLPFLLSRCSNLNKTNKANSCHVAFSSKKGREISSSVLGQTRLHPKIFCDWRTLFKDILLLQSRLDNVDSTLAQGGEKPVRLSQEVAEIREGVGEVLMSSQLHQHEGQIM